jgi:hypothetical protein
MWFILIPAVAFGLWYIPKKLELMKQSAAFNAKFRADGKAGRLYPQEQARYDAMYGKGN